METRKSAIEKNKLCLLYLFEVCDQRLSDNQLLYICNELDLMDYFDLNNCLSELSEAGLVDRSEAINGVFYSITEIGSSTYDFFKKQVPFSQRELIKEYADKHRDELLMQSRIFSEYLQIGEHQFRVILKILEHNLPVFEINLFAHSKEEAERFAVSWRKNAMTIYQNTISDLLKE
ncbi:MAG: DUF4364 family protein [Christensenellaceae bacterium]|nr:DUF4364 family protein [Christensenellaceae bacterium]